MHAESDPRLEEDLLSCPVCDHTPISVETDGTATCPSCRESYSLVVHESFALVETDGWTTGISFDVPEPLARDAAR